MTLSHNAMGNEGADAFATGLKENLFSKLRTENNLFML